MSREKDKSKGFRSPLAGPLGFVRGANENPAPTVISPEKKRVDVPGPSQEEESSAYLLAPFYIESGDPRVIIPFQVRLPEPLHLKLKFLADHLPNESMHSISLSAIEEKADNLVMELEKKNRRQ